MPEQAPKQQPERRARKPRAVERRTSPNEERGQLLADVAANGRRILRQAISETERLEPHRVREVLDQIRHVTEQLKEHPEDIAVLRAVATIEKQIIQDQLRGKPDRALITQDGVEISTDIPKPRHMATRRVIEDADGATTFDVFAPSFEPTVVQKKGVAGKRTVRSKIGDVARVFPVEGNARVDKGLQALRNDRQSQGAAVAESNPADVVADSQEALSKSEAAVEEGRAALEAVEQGDASSARELPELHEQLDASNKEVEDQIAAATELLARKAAVRSGEESEAGTQSEPEVVDLHEGDVESPSGETESDSMGPENASAEEAPLTGLARLRADAAKRRAREEAPAGTNNLEDEVGDESAAVEEAQSAPATPARRGWASRVLAWMRGESGRVSESAAAEEDDVPDMPEEEVATPSIALPQDTWLSRRRAAGRKPKVVPEATKDTARRPMSLTAQELRGRMAEAASESREVRRVGRVDESGEVERFTSDDLESAIEEVAALPADVADAAPDTVEDAIEAARLAGTARDAMEEGAAAGVASETDQPKTTGGDGGGQGKWRRRAGAAASFMFRAGIDTTLRLTGFKLAQAGAEYLLYNKELRDVHGVMTELLEAASDATKEGPERVRQVFENLKFKIGGFVDASDERIAGYVVEDADGKPVTSSDGRYVKVRGTLFEGLSSDEQAVLQAEFARVLREYPQLLKEMSGGDAQIEPGIKEMIPDTGGRMEAVRNIDRLVQDYAVSKTKKSALIREGVNSLLLAAAPVVGVGALVARAAAYPAMQINERKNRLWRAFESRQRLAEIQHEEGERAYARNLGVSVRELREEQAAGQVVGYAERPALVDSPRFWRDVMKNGVVELFSEATFYDEKTQARKLDLETASKAALAWSKVLSSAGMAAQAYRQLPELPDSLDGLEEYMGQARGTIDSLLGDLEETLLGPAAPVRFGSGLKEVFTPAVSEAPSALPPAEVPEPTVAAPSVEEAVAAAPTVEEAPMHEPLYRGEVARGGSVLKTLGEYGNARQLVADYLRTQEQLKEMMSDGEAPANASSQLKLDAGALKVWERVTKNVDTSDPEGLDYALSRIRPGEFKKLLDKLGLVQPGTEVIVDDGHITVLDPDGKILVGDLGAAPAESVLSDTVHAADDSLEKGVEELSEEVERKFADHAPISAPAPEVAAPLDAEDELSGDVDARLEGTHEAVEQAQPRPEVSGALEPEFPHDEEGEEIAAREEVPSDAVVALEKASASGDIVKQIYEEIRTVGRETPAMDRVVDTVRAGLARQNTDRKILDAVAQAMNVTDSKDRRVLMTMVENIQNIYASGSVPPSRLTSKIKDELMGAVAKIRFRKGE